MNEDYYYYTIPVLRAIEESYQTGYLMLGKKGVEYEVANPNSFAEYRCDFERGCKHIGRVVGRGRMSYKEVVEMVKYLNGERG